MRIALDARVSTSRQAQAQAIEQRLERLQAHVQAHGETVAERDVFRDADYSGASLSWPELDQLRDRAALAEGDWVVVAAPDRLARRYVHQRQFGIRNRAEVRCHPVLCPSRRLESAHVGHRKCPTREV